jgi:MYXO-CTERM domain-containing protein
MKNSAYSVLTCAALLSTILQTSATIVILPVDITTSTGATASQSSTLSGAYAPTNGINGSTTDFTHTNPPEMPPGNAWWQADLATDRTFTKLRLYNRADCCQGRFRDLTVSILDASSNVLYSQAGVNAGNVLNGPAFIDFTTGALSTARFIRVERTPIPGQEASHDGAVLSIGEVLVFNQIDSFLTSGTDLTHANIAAMTVSQSSTLGGFSAASAINGATNDFTHTLGTDTNPSWTVNFGESMNLESFNIGNRGDGCCQYRLRDITVSVRDSMNVEVWNSGLLNPENVLGGPSALTGSFPTGLQGQYVTISRTPDPDASGGGTPGNADDANVLSMSEVRIFGSSIPEPSAAMLSLLALAGIARRRR